MSSKAAKLLGAKVEVRTDPNAAARAEATRRGYRLPAGGGAEEEDPLALLDAHSAMPDIWAARAAVAAKPEAAAQLEAHSNFNLLVDVRNCAVSTGETAEVHVCVYSAARDEQLTEEFMFRLTPQGQPEPPAGVPAGSQPPPLACLFTDLRPDDFNRGELHVAFRVYRVGALVAEKKKKEKAKDAVRRPWGMGLVPLAGGMLDSLLVRSADGEGADAPLCAVYAPNSEKEFSRMWAQLSRQLAAAEDEGVGGAALAASTSTASLVQSVASELMALQPCKNAIGIAAGLRVVPGNVADPAVVSGGGGGDVLARAAQVPRRHWPGPRPGQSAHELQVLLVEGTFNAGLKSKKTEKNVIVRVTLRDKSRRPIGGSVTRGYGPWAKRCDSFDSSVHYHLNSPCFDERARFHLPGQRELEQCHLHFEFCHCSTSEAYPVPFAYAYMPILQQQIYTVVKNGGYSLIVYQYDKKTHNASDDYMRVDPEIKERIATRDRVVVRTELRSTQVSQDVDLHQLLNWRRSPRSQRGEVLDSCGRKDPAVVGRALGAVLGKLTEILSSTLPDYVEMHEGVFAALVRLLASTGRRRRRAGAALRDTAPEDLLARPQPYLEHYLEHDFVSPLMFIPLLKHLGSLFRWVNGPRASVDDPQYDTFAHAVRAADYVLRFTIRSFTMHLDNLYDAGAPGRDAEMENFAGQLGAVFRDINSMMARRGPHWIRPLQEDASANIRSVFDHVRHVVQPGRAAPLACDYARAVFAGTGPGAGGRTVVNKLVLFRELLASKVVRPSRLLDDPATEKQVEASVRRGLPAWQREFLPLVVRQVAAHMRLGADEMGDDDAGLAGVGVDGAESVAGSKLSLASSAAPPLSPGGAAAAAASAAAVGGGAAAGSRVRSPARVQCDLMCVRIMRDLLSFLDDRLRGPPSGDHAFFLSLRRDAGFLMPDAFRVLLDVVRPEVEVYTGGAAAGQAVPGVDLPGGGGSGGASARNSLASPAGSRRGGGFSSKRSMATGAGGLGPVLEADGADEPSVIAASDSYQHFDALDGGTAGRGARGGRRSSLAPPVAPLRKQTSTLRRTGGGVGGSIGGSGGGGGGGGGGAPSLSSAKPLQRSHSGMSSDGGFVSPAAAAAAAAAGIVPNPYDSSQLPPELADMDVLAEATAVACAIVRLQDAASFAALLEDLDAGRGLVPAGSGAGDAWAEPGSPPPPPPPPPEDGGPAGAWPPPPPPPDFDEAMLSAPPSRGRGSSLSLRAPAPPPRPAMNSAAVFELMRSAMLACQDLVETSAFRPYWVLLRTAELQMGATLLKWCAPTLRKHYMHHDPSAPPPLPEPSPLAARRLRGSVSVSAGAGMLDAAAAEAREREVWESFWLLGTSLLVCGDLDLERMTPDRADLVRGRFGDLRLDIAAQLAETWDAFESKKVQFAELLAAPIVRLAQSQLAAVKALGSAMYWDLLREGLYDGSALQQLQSHTIDAVGHVVHLFGTGRIRQEELNEHRQFFTTYLRRLVNEFASGDGVSKAGALKFLADVEELFRHLESLESLQQVPANEHERAAACLQLMRYLKRSGKHAMYVTYLQYLAELHDGLGNKLEQGNALLLHASELGWGAERLPKVERLLGGGGGGGGGMNNSGSAGGGSKASRLYLPSGPEHMHKTLLCNRAIEAFAKAGAWERCVEVHKILAEAYESTLYNIPSLVLSLRAQAEFHERVLAEDRIFPSYYRVAYYGSGFERDGLRGKAFVHRSGEGLNPESVKSFTDKIKAKHPGARVVNSSDMFGDADAGPESGGMLVQISALTPVSRGARAEPGQPQPPPRLRRALEQRTNEFTYSRVDKKLREKHGAAAVADNEYATLWAVRTTVRTAEVMPALQRRVPVESEEETVLSPVENAMEALLGKNRDLQDLTSNLAFDISNHRKVDVSPLSMMLSGIIDAAVSGGTAKYREAFFDDAFIERNPEQLDNIRTLARLMRQQIPMLKRALKLFRARCDDSLLPLYEHLSDRLDQMVAQEQP